MNLQIGQKVFVKKIGNAALYLDQKKAPIEEYVEEATVSKVGRKWFKVDGRYADYYQFDIETGRVDGKGYISDYAVYESWQEIYDEEERKSLTKELSKIFDAWWSNDISLPKLRAIKAIIEEA